MVSLIPSPFVCSCLAVEGLDGYGRRVVESSPLSPHQSSAAEIKARLEAERTHAAFVVMRGVDGAQRIVALDENCVRMTIGRGSGADICLQDDDRASRLHAELVPAAGEWMLVDDGLSSNGSFVGQERVSGRRRLIDGDVLRVGSTQLVFCRPGTREQGTVLDGDATTLIALTPAQRRVLIALCRPLAGGRHAATPATNPAIAAELFLSVPAVKTHMRALFAALAVDDLAQNQKRRRVVERAFQVGLVTDHDF